jgi:hypothetical protein
MAKIAFAESVVRRQENDRDFLGFDELLKRIEVVIKHYAAPSSQTTKPVNEKARPLGPGFERGGRAPERDA